MDYKRFSTKFLIIPNTSVIHKTAKIFSATGGCRNRRKTGGKLSAGTHIEDKGRTALKAVEIKCITRHNFVKKLQALRAFCGLRFLGSTKVVSFCINFSHLKTRRLMLTQFVISTLRGE